MKTKRPKSCPSVRWRSVHSTTSSALLTTSSSIISERMSKNRSEVKISSQACNYHRNRHLNYPILLLAYFTITIVSSSSLLSSVNHVAVEKYVKSNRDQLMNHSNQAARMDGDPTLIPVISVLGSNVTINCTDESDNEDHVAFDHHEIDRIWSRARGGPLLDENKFQVTSNGDLFIRDVMLEDEDIYTCIKSKNGHIGKPNQLHVFWSPRLKDFKKELPQIVVKPTAQTVRLDCDIDARPEAIVKWFHNGKEIETFGRIAQKSKLLIISQTVTSDSGNYSCQASNVVANVSFFVANLTIQASGDRPPKPKKVQVVTVSSTSVSLTWKPAPVTNDLPIVSYSVHFTPESGKEDQRITMTNNLLVEKLTPSTNYSFYVRAYNKKGASEPSSILRVQTLSLDEQPPTTAPSTAVSAHPFDGVSTSVPSTPVWFSLDITEFKSESPTSVLITWQKFPTAKTSAMASSSNKMKITSIEVHYRKHSQDSYLYLPIEDTDSNSALIEALQPGVKYDIRVVATLSSTTAPTNSVPNQSRPPANSLELVRWNSYEMPFRDSPMTTDLPPSNSKGNNNKNVSSPGIDSTSSIISSPTTQVPDSPFYNNISNINTENEELILGMVLDKFVAWSIIAIVIFSCLVAACILICCCKKGFLANGCSEGSSSEGRIYSNGNLPSMYGDTNGSESREMQLFIDRVGDPELDTKGGSPECKLLTTKLNGSNHVKSNIKTNGSLVNSQKYPNKSGSKSEKASTKGKTNQDVSSWSRKGDDGI